MPHGKSPTHARKPRKKKAAAGAKASSGAGRRSSPSKGRSTIATRGGGSRPSPDDSIGASTRLQKLLAAAGFGSRRQTEQFLIDKRVTVNGELATLGDRATPGVDDIRVDGERLVAERPSYWLLHKPRGIVTTVRDDEGRKTVIDLLPRSIERVFPVGRLDRETSGLLLLTNDGDTAHALLHPSLGNEREYKVSVKGQIDEKAIGRLEKGVVLEDGRTAPARVERVRFDPDLGSSSFSLTLGEGRKRQIRRSLLILGFPVRRLVRVRMGPLRLGHLPAGEARPLRSDERRALLDHVARLRSADGKSPRPGKSGARKTQRSPSSRNGARK